MEGRNANLVTRQMIIHDRVPVTIIIEPEDFKTPVHCARIARGTHAHNLFVPLAYKDTFEDTGLYKLLAPNFTIDGMVFSNIHYYE